jgi:hypothetical protein
MALSTLAIVGLGASIVGTGVQVYGQVKAAQAQRAQAAAFRKAENLRKKQMNLDAARRRREIIRQGIVARGLALNNAANQGALSGSGILGGLFEIGGGARRAVSQTNQNQSIGAGIFNANIEGGNAQGAEASALGTANLGAGLNTLGEALVQNFGTFNRVGTYLGATA